MVRKNICNVYFKLIEIYEEYKFGKSADDIENIESLENI
jgi:hypothetical protein